MPHRDVLCRRGTEGRNPGRQGGFSRPRTPRRMRTSTPWRSALCGTSPGTTSSSPGRLQTPMVRPNEFFTHSASQRMRCVPVDRLHSLGVSRSCPFCGNAAKGCTMTPSALHQLQDLSVLERCEWCAMILQMRSSDFESARVLTCVSPFVCRGLRWPGLLSLVLPRYAHREAMSNTAGSADIAS